VRAGHSLACERPPHRSSGAWGLSSHQTPPSRATFERSQSLQLDEATRVPRFMEVWCQRSFFSPSSLSPGLDFHANPLKIQEQPFNMLVLQIWFLFFLVWFFLSWIIYRIWSPIFWVLFFCLESFFKLIFFLWFHPPLLFSYQI
jgi:hypothetical protein